MIKLEKTVLPSPEQWDAIIRGMRNPMNSWEKSDSGWIVESYRDNRPHIGYDSESGLVKVLGPNDYELMMKLAKGGSVHAKYRRMIVVYVDITAPLYWWKEFDTYKVGTVANSCSTMHKIHERPFTVNDISCETLRRGNGVDVHGNLDSPDLKAHYKHMTNVLSSLNNLRDLYLKTGDKKYWRCIIEMLPSSYNQKRTVMLSYEVLANIYPSRKNHKLDEWHKFCDWIKGLPYSEIITGKEKEKPVDISTTPNTCVVCGEEIPEGRQVCPKCEKE